MSNLESQAKMRMLHPDLFISEAQDGSGVDLTDDGEYLIKTLTAHDFGQIGRMRADAINKMGLSKKVIQDMIDLANKQANKEKADLIKYMAGYIINTRANPKSTLKAYEEALKAIDKYK